MVSIVESKKEKRKKKKEVKNNMSQAVLLAKQLLHN